MLRECNSPDLLPIKLIYKLILFKLTIFLIDRYVFIHKLLEIG